MSSETQKPDGEETPKEINEVKTSEESTPSNLKGPYDLGNLTVEEKPVTPIVKKNIGDEKRGFNHDGGCY